MSFFGKPGGGEPRITYERIDLSADGAGMGTGSAMGLATTLSAAAARQMPFLNTAPPADTVVRPTAAAEPPAMLIAADSDMEGRLRSRGIVRVEGVLRGELHAASLILEPGGLIEGLVTVDHAQINGTLRGTLVARDVEISRTAMVDAELVYEEIGIERGARVRGLHRRRDPEPVAAEVPQQAATAPVDEMRQPETLACQTPVHEAQAYVALREIWVQPVTVPETQAPEGLSTETGAPEAEIVEHQAPTSQAAELAAVTAQTAALVAAAEAALQELSEVAQAAAGASAALAGEGISGLVALEDELRSTPTRLPLAAAAA